jgi:molybdopterin synthase sulfur carrier subunit
VRIPEVVRILFFASLRDAVGSDECSLSVQGPLNLEQLLAELKTELNAEAYSAICAENVRVAINQELAGESRLINPGDEVAFLPPVTGG